jgi:putative hydrolase of the HAD superfamily
VIRAVTIDFHGTLAVPSPSPGAIYASVGRAHGIDCDDAALDAAFPQAFRTVRDDWAIPYGSDEQDARDFWFAVMDLCFGRSLPAACAMELFEAFAQAEQWRPLPGAKACLGLLAERNIPVAICSNFDQRLVRLWRGLDLGPAKEVLASSLVGLPKPDPELLLLAASLLAVDPAEMLHLGDNPKEDGGAAEAAGCHWLPVEPGVGPDPDTLRARLDG